MGYLGSAWRGAFGHALRKTVCVTRLPACEPCVLVQSCPYPYLFESRTPPGAAKLSRYPRTPGPYVLEPADDRFDATDETYAERTSDTAVGDENADPAWPASTRLGVILFGAANDRLPYVVHALDRAARSGLTSRRIEFELVDVQLETQETQTRVANSSAERVDGDATAQDRKPAPTPIGSGDGTGDSPPRHWSTIYVPGGALASIAAEQPLPPEPPTGVSIRLLTPLRVKRGGHFAGTSDLDFRTFFGGLLRRISLLTYFFGDTPLETDFAGLLRLASSVPVTNAKLQWKEWTRYSSRQNTKLKMDGVVGSFDVIGASLEPFWPYLWLGQWAHAGKGTSMGLGRYVLQPLGASHGGDVAGNANSAGGNGSAEQPWATPARL